MTVLEALRWWEGGRLTRDRGGLLGPRPGRTTHTHTHFFVITPERLARTLSMCHGPSGEEGAGRPERRDANRKRETPMVSSHGEYPKRKTRPRMQQGKNPRGRGGERRAQEAGTRPGDEPAIHEGTYWCRGVEGGSTN
jgi:hypothetical protein